MSPSSDDDARSAEGASNDRVAPFRQRLRLDGVIGVSAALAAVLREVESVAPLDNALLITGPSGAGKTHLARLIRANSPRRGRPLVELHCAAIPESLVESELFGAMQGPDAGSPRRTEGKLAAAQGGTLLLEEVGELPMGAQARLLRLLHTKEYHPLGSSEPSTADVRIIATTNDDLARAVDERRFRADLLFRLQVSSIRVPSLSERREDIAPLARHFCELVRQDSRFAPIELSPAALRAIEANSEWGGNVRELAFLVNVAMFRAAAAGATSIEAAHVFPDIGRPDWT
ncbi:MAG TPA: sigma 54-interacting transcriptional regulator [Polyangiaceae bacterium]|nr:sigma 54-interacting transcriptional regulator [Polyangiaceae bacterium]